MNADSAPGGLIYSSKNRRWVAVVTRSKFNLGQPTKSHIIRTIEYWDIERKKYPDYDHCAVLIAEEITRQFQNVIAVFNGYLPLIAIQMQGLRVGSHNTIVFTKVFDYVPRGVVEEDEIPPEPADRAKWERKSSAAILQLVDQCLIILKGIDSKLELNYTVSYIGLSKDQQPFNFVTFQPRRHVLNITLNIPRSADVDQKIEDSGIETLEYRHERYRLALRNEEISKNKELLKELMELAYNNRNL